MSVELVHALSDAEAGVLVDCERVIERGLKTFVEVGRALARIRDDRLYRTDGATFEVYCETRWGFTDRRARQLIEAAEIGRILPVANAGQASELARAPEEQRAEVWAEAHERGNGRPTAATIREVVRERQPTAPPSTADATDRPAGRDHEAFPARESSSIGTPDRPGAEPPHPDITERPRPPKWDPEERRQHEETVRRNQAIEAARQQATTILTEVRSLVLTIVAGSRYGERGLVTPDMIRELRAVIDLLEGEL